MAEKNNAKCSICGRDYYMCKSCKDSIQTSPFKMYTDTAEHYKIFQILRGYNTKVYTKDEARTKLKNVNLSDLDTFKEHIKLIISDILKEEKSVVEAEADVMTEKIVAVEDVECVRNVEDSTIIEKTTVSRKRNYKVGKVEEE